MQITANFSSILKVQKMSLQYLHERNAFLPIFHLKCQKLNEMQLKSFKTYDVDLQFIAYIFRLYMIFFMFL